MKLFLQSFFKLRENNSDIRTELLAGFTTFITMAYIILVIPNILKFSGMNFPGIKGDGAAALTATNDPVVGAVFTAVCIGSGIGTILIGAYANLPFAIAPGIIFYPILKVSTGRKSGVYPIVYILVALFILRFILLPD